jgi:hypothetical protein
MQRLRENKKEIIYNNAKIGIFIETLLAPPNFATLFQDFINNYMMKS